VFRFVLAVVCRFRRAHFRRRRNKVSQKKMADAGKQQLPFILQGKYFAVKGQIEKDGALSAWCKNCPNRVLKGHLHAPSNFHKHLRVSLLVLFMSVCTFFLS
jgi:hypothetical protein